MSEDKPAKFVQLLTYRVMEEPPLVILYALDENGDVWASSDASLIEPGWYKLTMTRHPEPFEEVWGLDDETDDDPGDETEDDKDKDKDKPRKPART